MSTQKPIDMDAPRTFFDPHPGFAGAAIPIPARIKSVADLLSGKTMSLKDAVTLLKAVHIGSISVIAEGSWIKLHLKGSGRHAEHVFRVIKFR